MASSDTVSFRQASAEDADAVSAFARRVFQETFGPSNDPRDMAMYSAKAFTPAVQAAELSDPARICIVGEAGTAIVCYALLRTNAMHEAVGVPKAVEIERFYVDSRLHGQGVAQSMMNEVMRIAKAADAPAVWLGVWSENPRAIRFYEKQGFADVGSHTFVLGTDEQVDRVMVRRLSA